MQSHQRIWGKAIVRLEGGSYRVSVNKRCEERETGRKGENGGESMVFLRLRKKEGPGLGKARCGEGGGESARGGGVTFARGKRRSR